MAQAIADFLGVAVGIAWGLPLVILCIGCGLLFTIQNRFVQIRRFKDSIQKTFAKKSDSEAHGALTPFQALAASLSGTVGLGNIAGVAVAVGTGGPGALFWMWVVAFVGMATKFVSCSLAIMYRKINPDDTTRGGPMYYIEMGLGPKWKPMAQLFAFLGIFAVLGAGNMFQANQVAQAWETHYGFETWQIGAIMVVMVAIVIIGGIRRIGHVAGALVPVMCVIYLIGGLYVILMNFTAIPSIIAFIVKDAFTGNAVAGGAFGTVLIQGVRRGVFSNEAGLGTEALAHSTARVKEPLDQGLVAMLGPFIDTLIVCSVTGIVIVSTQGYESGLKGVDMTIYSFDAGFKGFGSYFVITAVTLFAYSTMLAYSYYGEKCSEYLFGDVSVMPFKIIFLGAIFLGAVWKLQPVLDFSDLLFAMMAVPNLLACVLLSKRIAQRAKEKGY